MNQKVQEKLLDVLFEGVIVYHARRKTRQWCSCEYCRMKYWGTRRIQYGIRGRIDGFLTPGYMLHQIPRLDEEEYRDALERVREKHREVIRSDLYNLRTAHLPPTHKEHRNE